MKIQLAKEAETREVKAGATLYLLLSIIPFGGIAVLIMSIMRKQFKGLLLNMLVTGLVIYGLFFVVLFIGAILGGISTGLGAFIVLLATIAFLVAIIYLYIHLIINGNKYSLAQYLEDGYEIVNAENLDEEAKLFVEANKNKKRAKFLFLKF